MWWHLDKQDRKSAIVIWGSGILYSIPLLGSGRPYIDDLGRTLSGNGAWTSAGRPLADLVMLIINLGAPIVDLAPMMQLLAIFILCASCILLYKWTAGLVMPPVMRAGACASFLFNPFLIENLSYRFDSLTQALSIGVALVALHWTTALRLRAILLGAVLILASLSLYQVAVNVALCGTVLLLVVGVARRDDHRTVLIAFATRLAAIALGLAVYLLTVNRLTGQGFYSPYAEWHSAMVSLDLPGLRQVVGNARHAFDQVWGSFDAAQRATLLLPGLVAWGGLLVLAGQTIRQGLALAMLLAIAPALIVLGVFGAQAALAHPVYHPRVYVAFGIVPVFVLLFGLAGATKVTALLPRHLGGPVQVLLATLLFAPAAIGLINVAYANGAAQIAQRDLEMLVAADVGKGMAELGAAGARLAVDGTVPFAPPVTAAIKRYPLLDELVFRSLDNDWFWGSRFLVYHGVPLDTGKVDRETVIAAARMLPAEYVGANFTLTRVGDVVVLRFGDSTNSAVGGLVSLWTFSEGSGTAIQDASGVGNDGTLFPINGDSGVWGSGEFAGTLSLSGAYDDHVLVPASDSLNRINTQLTVAATVYARALRSESDKYPGFVALVQRQWQTKTHPDQYYLGFGIEGGVQKFKWHLGLSDGGEIDIYSLPMGAEEHLTGRWMQVVGTYDGSSGMTVLYVNGDRIAWTTRPGAIRLDNVSRGRPLVIGAELNGTDVNQTDGEFDGYIDEVRVYDRALGADEVKALAAESNRKLERWSK